MSVENSMQIVQTYTISKSLYCINCTVHPDPVGAVS